MRKLTPRQEEVLKEIFDFVYSDEPLGFTEKEYLEVKRLIDEAFAPFTSEYNVHLNMTNGATLKVRVRASNREDAIADVVFRTKSGDFNFSKTGTFKVGLVEGREL